MVRLFGVLALLSFASVYYFYAAWFISVWCFFAALLSITILLHLKGDIAGRTLRGLLNV